MTTTNKPDGGIEHGAVTENPRDGSLQFPVNPETGLPRQPNSKPAPLIPGVGAEVVEGVRIDDRVALADQLIRTYERLGMPDEAQEVREAMAEYGLTVEADPRFEAQRKFDAERGPWAPNSDPASYDLRISLPGQDTETVEDVNAAFRQGFALAGLPTAQAQSMAERMIACLQWYAALPNEEAQVAFIEHVKAALPAAERENILRNFAEWSNSIKARFGSDASEFLAEAAAVNPTVLLQLSRAMDRKRQRESIEGTQAREA